MSNRFAGGRIRSYERFAGNSIYKLIVDEQLEMGN